MPAIKTLDLTHPLPAIFSGHLKLGSSRPQGKTIGFTNLYMTRDGQPCIPVMGEFHFSRYPHADWEDALLKMKTGGISLAATYVFWNHIEEEVAEIKSVSAAVEQRISIKLEGSKPPGLNGLTSLHWINLLCYNEFLEELFVINYIYHTKDIANSISFSAANKTNNGHFPDMESREEFIKHLHETLNHLSDPKKLLASPMVGLLKLSNRPDKILALQNILIDAIKTIQPPTDSPSTSKAWRQYESLHYRYIEGFSQREVAEQLNLGVRHLQREQNSALEILADSLIRQFKIQETPIDHDLFNGNSSDLMEAEESELAWLKEYSINSPLEVQPALTSIFETISIIAKGHNVQINVNIQENLPGLAVHPVAFNQIMLNLLTAGITLAENGWISVAAFPADDVICIEIQTAKSTKSSIDSLNELTLKIKMAQRLLSICGGKLEVMETFSLFKSTITIPVFDRQVLLVLDDNPDTLQLFERYCSNTRYQVIPCQDPSEIIDMAKEQSPDIIIIDVMMPQIDGWLVLSRLRMHPLTGSLPIIICTILPQEELALSLGATGYLRKPFNRQKFLKMLETISLKKKKSH